MEQRQKAAQERVANDITDLTNAEKKKNCLSHLLVK